MLHISPSRPILLPSLICAVCFRYSILLTDPEFSFKDAIDPSGNASTWKYPVQTAESWTKAESVPDATRSKMWNFVVNSTIARTEPSSVVAWTFISGSDQKDETEDHEEENGEEGTAVTRMEPLTTVASTVSVKAVYLVFAWATTSPASTWAYTSRGILSEATSTDSISIRLATTSTFSKSAGNWPPSTTLPVAILNKKRAKLGHVHIMDLDVNRVMYIQRRVAVVSCSPENAHSVIAGYHLGNSSWISNRAQA
ncbi:hypothetical protein BG003_007459 [Podila horticola]|nr:hypothetical protein BG003_007459 [Podila horticola]